MDATLPLPELTELNRPFWTSGADGRLRIQRCDACSHWIQPPGVICPQCRGRALSFVAVSGRATVEAVTVNHQAWAPGMQVPFTLAIVSLEEDSRVRLTTRIVEAEPDSVRIGAAVAVRFEAHGDVHLPFFQPARGPNP